MRGFVETTLNYSKRHGFKKTNNHGEKVNGKMLSIACSDNRAKKGIQKKPQWLKGRLVFSIQIDSSISKAILAKLNTVLL